MDDIIATIIVTALLFFWIISSELINRHRMNKFYRKYPELKPKDKE